MVDYVLSVVCDETKYPIPEYLYDDNYIGYTSDAAKYRNKEIKYCFREYALYAIFFPYVISGPIVRHNQLIPQLRDLERKKFNSEKFAKGISGKE